MTDVKANAPKSVEQQTQDRLRQAVRAIGVLEGRLKAKDAAANAPIAVIGMGCRFPGGIEDPARLWEVLRNGEDMVGEIPADRWDIDAFHDPQILAPGKIITREGAVLRNVDGFDADYFGISPREARAMDPQQRIALEVAKEAFDHAGLSNEAVEGSACGVFMGVTESEYAWHNYVHLEGVDSYTATGSYGGIVANRISYLFDLKGPSFTVDSICSSSLLAVHQAVEALRRGECETALAGGICVLTGPDQMIWLSKLGVLAKGNRCRAFDAAGDGIVLGEGCGLVVLKPLAQAQKDGDRVLAVIRGNGATQDGRSNGMTAPSRAGQEAMLRQAYAKAGRSPQDVGYVDGHGTGTQLGDPIEAAALGAVLGKGRSPDTPLRIGSVKSNLAHLGPAGGIASLMKVVLALQNREIPASLHFNTANPDIPMADWGLEVPTTAMAWPQNADKLPLAGVTSLAFGGTNVHVVLEAAPEPAAADPASADPASPNPASPSDLTSGARLLPLTARSQAALQARAGQWSALLAAQSDEEKALLSAAARQQSNDPWRALVWVREDEDLQAPLAALAEGKSHPNLRASDSASVAEKPVFVCSGHGSHYLGMARGLIESAPVFAEHLKAYDEALSAYVDWSLLDHLGRDDSPLLEDTTFLQPALTGIQIALAALWRHLGVEPAAVIGVSMGEVAAAQIAGLLNLDEAARIITLRTKLLARDLLGQGAMAVCDLSWEEVEPRLAAYDGKLSVAVAQGPRSTVLSGDPEALERLGKTLEADEVFFRLIKVDFASHSHFVDPVLKELVSGLGQVGGQAAKVPFWSSAKGELLEGKAVGASYWADNLRQPVLLQPLVTRLVKEEGLSLFLELSPHPLLTTALQETFADLRKQGTALPSLNRDQADWQVLLSSLAGLYARGVTVDWSTLLGRGSQVMDLPAYPWQRQSYWLDGKAGLRPELQGAGQGSPVQAPGILIGKGIADPAQPRRHLWPLSADENLTALLAQHQVLGKAVLPAAAAITSSLALLSDLELPATEPSDLILQNLSFDSFAPLARLEDTVLVSQQQNSGVALQLLLAGGDKDSQDSDVLFSATAGPADGSAPAKGSPETMAQSLTDSIDPASFYETCQKGGGSYGPAFQLLEEIRQGDGEALARLGRGNREKSDEAFGADAAIAVLDACLQTSFAAVAEGVVPMVPLSIGRVQCWGELSHHSTLYCHVLRQQEQDDRVRLDLSVMTPAGDLLLKADGLVMRRANDAGQSSGLSKRLVWLQQDLPAVSDTDDADKGLPILIVTAEEPGSQRLKQLGLSGELTSDLRIMTPQSAVDWLLSAPEDELAAMPRVVYLAPAANEAEGWPAAGALALQSKEALAPLLAFLQAAGRRDLVLADGLTLVTRGAQRVQPADRVDPVQAGFWTLGQSASLEQPGLALRLLDLEPEPGSETAVPQLLAALEDTELSGHHLALRDGRLLAARLTSLASDGKRRSQAVAGDRDFRLAQLQKGLPDSLAWVPRAPLTAGPGEVVVAVEAAALNFLDVARALGLVNFDEDDALLSFGMEAAGQVVALGDGVKDLEVGQKVLAMTASPRALARHLVTPASLVRPLPRCKGQELSIDQAAAQPIAYLTALYALQEEGRLKAGEKVLIHAASGGVGLAALAVAQAVGAEVYATAGSEEKRRFLHDLGCKHVYDSRSLAFAEQINRDTDGAGVDLVLNSLAGEAAEASLALLAPFGRFLEIGKADQQKGGQLALKAFANNLSYHAIDLAKLLDLKPQDAGLLLDQLCQGLESGSYPLLPSKSYSSDQVQAAVTDLARARHIGKLVISLQEADKAVLSQSEALSFSSDACVVITGGTGGLGLCFARWAVEQGAGKLVMLARNAPADSVRKSLADLEDRGVELQWLTCDVTREEEVRQTLAEVAEELGPIEGLFHGAAAIEDGPLTEQSWESFERVLAPKVAASLTLLSALQDQPLKLLAFFSSTAALLGTSGQANYAVANGMMVALAEQAAAAGLPAKVIDWGPWAQVGGVARLGLEGRFSAIGLTPHQPEQALRAFEEILGSSAVRAGVLDLTTSRWLAQHPGGDPAYLSLLQDKDKAGDAEESDSSGLKARLIALEPDLRLEELVAELQVLAAGIVGVTAESIDPLEQTLGTLGFDSLMSLELRNRLEAILDLKLPATLAWNYPVFADLARHLLDRLGLETGLGMAGGPEENASSPDKMPEVLGEEAIADMSEEEAEAELLKRLAGLENSGMEETGSEGES
ncbi:type I polyketide synthase [Rhodovibrionaceae bacterium A322]